MHGTCIKINTLKMLGDTAQHLVARTTGRLSVVHP